MSTCPRCKGFLGEDHKCPRPPVRQAVETAAFGATGAIVALLVVALVAPAGSPSSIDIVALIAGAAMAVLTRRLLRG